MGKRGGDKRAQFIRSNLELLGFGNARDALIQTVKELFENALDAVVSGVAQGDLSTAHAERVGAGMLRVRVQWNHETGYVDVVCADTGTGMRAHEIRQLCCGMFETTKASGGVNGRALSCGKYGLGLKAATLYSQTHVPNASLKVATTSDSSEILYIELRIHPESEEPAVVKHVESFSVDEGHRQFSGTEMRISIPAADTQEDVEYAADILAVYFQSLRYTVPESVGVEFALEIGETCVELGWSPGVQAVDRFSVDFGASVEELVYATRSSRTHNTNCMALLISDGPVGDLHDDIEITLLRYANHVPLVNADDFFLCSLTKGLLSNSVWKKVGHHCRRNTSHLVSQLVASPTQTRRAPSSAQGSTARLVIAIDVSVDVGVVEGASVKYTNLKKTTLDKIYLKDTQHCCCSIIEQLHQRGSLVSPQQSRDDELFLEYAPLVANAVASILNRSRQLTATLNDESRADEDSLRAEDEVALLTASLQRVLGQRLDKPKYSMELD